MVKTRTTLCAVLVALMLPSAAAARSHPGLPPGNSGAYQYVESIPTAGGSKPDATLRSDSGPLSGSVVPASTQRALLNDGSGGRTAYSVAAATTPLPRAARVRDRAHARAHPRPVAAAGYSSPPGSSSGGGSASGTSRESAILDALTGLGGSGGTGVALPTVLIFIAGAAVALRVRRRSPTD